MQQNPRITSRQRWFAVVSIVSGTLIGLLILEAGLRIYQYRLRHSETMSPGFILYDDQLGWKLARDWSGQHETREYRVTYRTNSEGFRASNQNSNVTHSCGVLGDSFTFGLGVNDDETFIEVMNRAAPGLHFINYAVPGYSTDQQWLLLRENPAISDHDCLILVVYLGNDLFDNLLPFPLQAEHAKPYVDLLRGELVIRNEPVPLLTKSSSQQEQDLSRLNSLRSVDTPLLRRLLNTSAAGALLIDYLAPESFSPDIFANHFNKEVKIFNHLLTRILDDSAAAQPVLVLLAGRSYVEQPQSYSGAFQEYFRTRIQQLAATAGVPVIDLAALLRSDYINDHLPRYYPEDGHLNALGHVQSAGILLDHLENLLAPEKIPD